METSTDASGNYVQLIYDEDAIYVVHSIDTCF